MKKLLLFTSAKTVDSTIQHLGKLGAVDITYANRPYDEVLQRISDDITDVQNSISLLNHYKRTSNTNDLVQRSSKKEYDPKRIVGRILKSITIKHYIEQTLDDVSEQLAFYDVWGTDFKIKAFNALKQKGIYVRLYHITTSEFDTLSKTHTLVAFPETEKKIPVVLFSQNSSETLDFEEVVIPSLTFETLNTIKVRKERQLTQLDLFLSEQLNYFPVLNDYLRILQNRLNAETAVDSMGNIDGKVNYLKGYLPVDAVADFKVLAGAQQWGFAISEPTDIDEVPVYIKNPKWIRIISPMMKFIDIVPGYKEIDVSIYFLVAFALFFAMLVGDAGYGILFLVLTVVFRKKISTQLRTLIYVLSGATIIWGILSGTYFGAEQIAQLPFLNRLVIPEISSFGVDNINFMMHLSFLIGAIHLTVAHSIRVVQFSNSIKALSEVGWVCLVWGLYVVTEQLVLGRPAPSWFMWLFAVGILLVVFCSKESTSFLKSVGASVANLPLSLISGFSDIVSYVRLFAVGMATVAVAASFNMMALPDGVLGMGILDVLMAVVALVLGHTLNIALALMAVMVHGIRLNMLEFAGHLGVQFSGEAYTPFVLFNRNTD